MRKYVIGIVVGLVFVVYSMVLRNQHSGLVIAPAAVAPKSSSSGSSQSTTSGNSAGSTAVSTAVQYKDGTYTGDPENAVYGNVQISVAIQGGKITTINFLQSPNENPNSIYVNQQADPYLKREAVQSQSANVSVITGATLTSQAFVQSLASALSQAKT